MSLPKFIPVSRTKTLTYADNRVIYTEVDWKATMEFAFDCLTINPHPETGSHDIKLACIDWLTGQSEQFEFACRQLEIDPEDTREKAVRILGLSESINTIH